MNQAPATTEPDTITELEAAFEEIDVEQPLVGIIMSSPADKEAMKPAGRVLQENGIEYEVRVMSLHEMPETVIEYCRIAKTRGLRVIIAGAGRGAALAGVAAAHTELPVIGVPISDGALGGIDALLAIAQAPAGVPVATVGIDDAANAGALAARIIGA